MQEHHSMECNSEHHHGRRECCRKKGHKHHRHGAKTFRRGRAIAFWEMLNQKRETLKKQLETPELQSINPVLVGELKAIDMIMEEFVRVFELYEVEEKEHEPEEQSENHSSDESDHPEEHTSATN